MPRHSNFDEISKIPLEGFHETGVNGFFRVVSNNLNHQNSLADNKANIMISINAVILSILIGSATKNNENWQNLFIPIIIFVFTTLLTTIFAILVIRPTFKKGIVTQLDLDNKKTTLLFFGNFTSLSPKDFEDSMLTILKDDEYLYRSILADFYGLGKVLERKYRLLTYSYNTFLIGLALVVLFFAIFQYHNYTS
jgi:hypothetical protein